MRAAQPDDQSPAFACGRRRAGHGFHRILVGRSGTTASGAVAIPRQQHTAWYHGAFGNDLLDVECKTAAPLGALDQFRDHADHFDVAPLPGAGQRIG